MGYFIGVDPSFTRTGLALIEESSLDGQANVIEVASISAEATDVNKYQLECTLPASRNLANTIINKITEWCSNYSVEAIVIEYPVLASRSGAYLGLIQQALFDCYDRLIVPVISVPSTAIKSLSKYKTKSQLVHWCQSTYRYSCETVRRGRWCINHDECSAIVLAHIAYLIRTGKYGKSFKKFYIPEKSWLSKQ